MKIKPFIEPILKYIQWLFRLHAWKHTHISASMPQNKYKFAYWNQSH